MKERPILFSGAMVRALLDGSKTQTRRVMKPQPSNVISQLFIWKDNATPLDELLALCPHGQPGDRLWVREAWKAHATFDHLPPRDIPQSHVWYMADDGYKAESRFRQSMFMPRWASRTTLEITGVRVERLQDISEADAKAEGVKPIPCDHIRLSCKEIDCAGPDYRSGFAFLWQSTGGDWAANPWVWVIEFRRAA